MLVKKLTLTTAAFCLICYAGVLQSAAPELCITVDNTRNRTKTVLSCQRRSTAA